MQAGTRVVRVALPNSFDSVRRQAQLRRYGVLAPLKSLRSGAEGVAAREPRPLRSHTTIKNTIMQLPVYTTLTV